MSGENKPDVKQCCASFYGSGAARFLLGDSFHPGGLRLTQRLGQLGQLHSGSRVLDVAAGRGASAIHLAESFACSVIGIDLSDENVSLANAEASARNLSHRVSFLPADAEQLPFYAQTFDAVLCECAFCTFPSKQVAAAEFFRVLKPGGCLGISDLTRTASPIPELDGLLAWIACIGDAQPIASYVDILQSAGFNVSLIEDHSGVLMEMVQQIQGRLLALEISSVMKKLDFASTNLPEAKRFAHATLSAIREHKLGYAILSAVRPF